MKPGLECHCLSIARRMPNGEDRLILRDIDATFAAGHLTLISGETGAGKSTLLHVLAGLLRPTRGEVLANGDPVSRWVSPHRDRWRRHLGIVFQSDCLLDDLNVIENVYLPLLPRGHRLAECRFLAAEALERMQVLRLARESVYRLSGGERQRVSIARALVSKPAFLLADEPTAHQDRKSAMAVIATLSAAAEAGATVVVAAHDARLLTSDIIRFRYRLERGRLRMLE